MGKRGSGVIFDVPLIATENKGVVKIAPDPQGPNWVHWNPATTTFTFHKDKFTGMRKKDHHLVQFTLVDDQTTTGLRFPRDPKNAMWVVNQARCPGPTDTCQYDIMRPLAVIDEDSLLAVNFNETKGQKLGFTLNFVRRIALTIPVQRITFAGTQLVKIRMAARAKVRTPNWRGTYRCPRSVYVKPNSSRYFVFPPFLQLAA